MNEVCNEFIKPTSKDKSFVQYLLENFPQFVKPKADIFISYCWGYNFTQLMEALSHIQATEFNGKDMFVWLDSFLVNQHESKNVSQEQWIATFGDSLRTIGRASIVLLGWKDLLYSTRAWCIFEIYKMVTLQLKYTITLPAREREDLKQAMIAYGVTYEFVESFFSKINIAEARAAKMEDKDMILNLIKKNTTLVEVNNVVLNRMKQWLVDMALSFIDEEKANENTKPVRAYYYSLYNVYSFLKQKQDALRVAERCLSISRTVYGEESFESGVMLVNISGCLDDLNRPEESLKKGEEALAIYRKVLPENHKEVAVLLGNIGLTLKNMQRYDEALKKYQEALKIKMAIDPGNVNVATTLSTMGVLFNAQKQYDKALEYHSMALTIRLKHLGENHVQTGTTYNNIAFVYKNLGKTEEMKENGRKAYEIMKRVYGESHQNTKDVLHWVEE